MGRGARDFEFPWALAAMGLLMVVALCHRLGPSGDSQKWSGYFLLKEPANSASSRKRWHRVPLLMARLVAVILLSLGAAGPDWGSSDGTLVLAAGPVDVQEGWSSPLTIVRAGYPPRIEEKAAQIRAVDAPANWNAALALGRRVAPQSRLVMSQNRGHGAFAIKSAQSELVGADVVVSITAEASVTPELKIGQKRYALQRRGTDWYFKGFLPPGPAEIWSDGMVRRYLCIPDAKPLRVAANGWPQAVKDVLEVIPHVKFVADGPVDWTVGQERVSGVGWSAFIPMTTTFTFAQRPNKDTATLWFESDLPMPNAVVRRWSTLNSGGEVLMRANGIPVVDRVQGPPEQAFDSAFIPGLGFASDGGMACIVCRYGADRSRVPVVVSRTYRGH